MKQIHFKFGIRGLKEVVYLSHSGKDWNKWIGKNELEYWINTYNEFGYQVIFKNLI